MQNKFAFFANFAETIRAALPAERQAEAYQAICEYGIYGTLPEDPMLKSMCLMFFSLPHRGAPVGNKNAQKKQIETKNSTQNNSKQIKQFETNRTIQKEKKKNTPLDPQEEKNKNIYTPTLLMESCPQGDSSPQKKFEKPTVEEVRRYCLERENGVDSERWFDFYQSKGWRVGSQPMKDWKAAVRTWERRNDYRNQPEKQNDDDFYKKLEAL